MGDLGTNIRNLREAFGETQLELAQALNLESPATVSMYESGDRGQHNYEVISKIAYHYRITEDQLVRGDFSGWDMKSIRLDEAYERKALYYIFPILSKDEDLADESFRKGFDLQAKARKDSLDRYMITKMDLLAALQAYEDSECRSATANSVIYLLNYGVVQIYGDMLEGVWMVQDEKLTKKQFYKEYYLRDVGTEERERLARYERKVAFFNEFGGKLSDALCALYADPDWRMEADYYGALRYIIGLIQNLHSDEENRRIGGEMMRSLAAMGNPYAKGFRKVIDNVHKV